MQETLKKSKIFQKLRKFIKAFIKPLSIAFVIFTFAFILYHLKYARKIIPGVTVGDIRLGGKTFVEAKKALEKQEEKNQGTLVLSYGDFKFEIKGADIGLEYSIDATVSRAFEVGRTGDLFIDNKDKLAGLIKLLRVPAIYTFEDEDLSLILSGIKGEINTEAQNAGFTLEDKKLVKTQSVEGVYINNQKLYDTVLSSFNNIDFSEKIIEVDRTSPTILIKDLDGLEGKAEKVVFNPLKITYDKKFWALSPEQVLDLVKVVDNDGRFELGLNKDNFDTYIDALRQEVNEPPRGQVTETDGNKVVTFKIIQNGRELDGKTFTEGFKDALFNVKPSIEISFREVKESDDPSKYGIFSLLGEGQSRFVGSASGRIHNLSLAAERTNGVLVPPDSVYSLNKSIGEISFATGYNTAYIITNGRTVLGEGGGECQT